MTAGYAVPDDVLAALLERKYGAVQLEVWDPPSRSWQAFGPPVPVRSLHASIPGHSSIVGSTVRVMQHSPGAAPIPVLWPVVHAPGHVYSIQVRAELTNVVGA